MGRRRIDLNRGRKHKGVSGNDDDPITQDSTKPSLRG